MLKPSDFAELYKALPNAPATFDCGKKCAPFNDGEPFCCDTGWVVPIAWREEFKYLQPRTNLWHEFRPRSTEEFEMIDEVDADENIFLVGLHQTRIPHHIGGKYSGEAAFHRYPPGQGV